MGSFQTTLQQGIPYWRDMRNEAGYVDYKDWKEVQNLRQD